MKINNLQEVLEYARLDSLPEKNNDVPFKYAIGTVKTNAIEESFCILKMLEGKPEVKKIFVGGMILGVIGDVFPYDFEGVEQPIKKETKVAQIKEKAPKTPKNDKVLKPIISDQLKEEIKEQNIKAIEEKAKEEASWLIEGIETFEQAKEWVKVNWDFVLKNHKPFLSKMVDEVKFKSHFRELAQKYLLENKK